MHEEHVAAVLEFWFAPGMEASWFAPSADFDSEIERRFLALVGHALDGSLDSWAVTADGALALAILLDQFPRNIDRGSPRAFAGDRQACAVAHSAIRKDFDQTRPPHERLFFYLPLGHSETIADQDEAVRLAATLDNPFYLERARHHRAIIARFGRFPHRNAVLGRANTASEQEFLDAGG